MSTSEKNVTVVVTSCNRHDLLRRTLDSFVTYDTSGMVKRVIIVEDSYTYPHFVQETEAYGGYEIHILNHRPRLGHLLSIDVAYKYVDTDYIFHCEDDWEFYAAGFIETSLAILQKSPQIMQVHLRHPDDVFPMGTLECTVDASKKFALIDHGMAGSIIWHGFSFNPGLRRLSDYKRLGCYSPNLLTSKYRGQHFETFVGELYREHGYVAAISLFNQGKGFVRHIGDNRHVF